MIPFSTPKHEFELLNVDASKLKKMRITYSQDDIVILRKEGDEITIDGNTAIVHLTQEEIQYLEELYQPHRLVGVMALNH